MIYIIYDDYRELGRGVWNKIQAQCQVFKQAFGNVFHTRYSGQMLHLFQDDNLVEKQVAITKRECNNIIINWLIKYKIQRSYIRFEFADRWFLEFLKKQEELGVKSVLEFPSIPYDGIFRKQIVPEDHYYREQMHKYIKCCVTFGNYNEVFHIPCFPIPNGVDIKGQKEKQYRKKDGTINLLEVAIFWKVHGCERILEGLYNYYNNGGRENFIFNIVGKGAQLDFYSHLVEKFGLQEHVIFHGELYGKKLDDIYDNSDIAIGELGFYKIGAQSAAPIKSSEYCARGIPFVYGYDELSFNERNYFAYKVSNDATPIDMKEIVNFYNDMYDGRDFVKDMRQYATENLTWDRILQPIIEFLE